MFLSSIDPTFIEQKLSTIRVSGDILSCNRLSIVHCIRGTYMQTRSIVYMLISSMVHFAMNSCDKPDYVIVDMLLYEECISGYNDDLNNKSELLHHAMRPSHKKE